MEERFAVCTVVSRCAPVSSHLGDRAVVYADGRMQGFIGGACSREIVRRQALVAMRSAQPRLVRIRPDATQTLDEGETVTVPMTCTSEGAVDVYVEPHLPKRRLLVAGFTPVAIAIADLGAFLDFEVARFVGQDEIGDAQRFQNVLLVDSVETYVDLLDDRVRSEGVAIAASQGHYDEEALRVFLKHDLAFVGLLASPKRAAALANLLAGEGIAEERLAKLHAPVGLAIGARRPADVAVSVFAEIISEGTPISGIPDDTAILAEIAVDPVCGMDVDVAAAKHSAEFEGRNFFFCCPHCRASFLKEPQRYAAAIQPA